MTGVGARAVLAHDWLTGMRGGEKVLQQLCGLLPGAPIYTLFHFPGTVSSDIESHPIHTSYLQRAPGLRRHYRYFLPLYAHAVERFRLPGCDLVVSSSHCVAKGVLPPAGALHVCYCHTPVRYAWDQEAAYFPTRRGPLARLRSWVLARLRRWDVASSSRVDRFVANSSFVAERIRRYYDRSSEVVAPPVDVGYFTPAQVPREPFCLFVSALAPYKRIDLAMAACAALGLELRVVGDGPARERLEAAARQQAGPGVRLLGRVEPEVLRDLYRRALCFVQPGVEDFGISAVEALACGCPVVALGKGGVRDIVEDGRHGLLYDDEGSAEALAAAIDKIRKLRFNSLDLRERAETFSTERFVQRMKKLLRLDT